MLEAKKLELETQVNESLQKRVEPRLTRLTEDQIRDAEATLELAGGRRLVECVKAGVRVMPSKEQKPAAEALTDWVESLRTRKRLPPTITKNKNRIAAFIFNVPGLKPPPLARLPLLAGF